jgi:hypothetical protein
VTRVRASKDLYIARDVFSSASLAAVSLSLPSRAAADRRSSFDKTVAVDTEAFVVLGEDEAVVLSLVEPEHHPVHSRALFVSARLIGTLPGSTLAHRAGRQLAPQAMPSTRRQPSLITTDAHPQCGQHASAQLPTRRSR